MKYKDNIINKRIYKRNKKQNIIISLNQINGYNIIKQMKYNVKVKEINSKINITKINFFFY